MRTVIDITAPARRARADYSWTVVERHVRIIDNDLGGMSVTNDLERVLLEICRELVDPPELFDWLYCDSTGAWDRIQIQPSSKPGVYDVAVLPGPGEPPEIRDNMVVEP